jgi:hypothetical protein
MQAVAIMMRATGLFNYIRQLIVLKGIYSV